MRKGHTRFRRLRIAITTLIAAAVIPFGVSALANGDLQTAESSRHKVSRPLIELSNIDQLRSAFERDTGKIRIIALVSPT